MSFFSKLSIRVTAPVLLVLPVLLVAGILIAIGAIQGRLAVERLASQHLITINALIEEHINHLVELPAKANQMNAALIESGRLDLDQPREWAEMLIKQFNAFKALSAITWGDEQGRCTWVARYAADNNSFYYAIKDEKTGGDILEYKIDEAGVISAVPNQRFEFDPRVRPWYVTPKQAGEAAWSKPFVWVGGNGESQSLGLAYGWPIKDDYGKLLGVIDADLTLRDLSDYLQSLQIGKTGRVFIVDKNGLMLASSTRAILFDKQGERLEALQSQSAWIHQAAARVKEVFPDGKNPDKPYQKLTEIQGKTQWLSVSPYSHHTGLEWLVVTVVPESDFMSEIADGQRRKTWFTAGITLATVALGIFLAMTFVKPLVRLSRHVRLIGEGKLDQEIALPYSSELTLLSSDINQMSKDLKDRMNLRRSLAVAMEVQQSLLPSQEPKINGLDIAGHSTYCDETGGDYYDYLDIADVGEGTVVVTVGDVMGHGIAAAMLMATARGILRSHCTAESSLSRLLEHMNNLLVEVTGGKRFMTMVLLTLDSRTGKLRIASAGHDEPFIYDPEKDAFLQLEEAYGGLPLGIIAGETYVELTYGPLPVGTIILASTDGVWEAQNETGKMFGKEKVESLIRSHAHMDGQSLADLIKDEVMAFCGQAKRLDDITFVVIKRTDR